MTETEKTPTEPGPLERLAGKGDEALRRLAAELERSARLPEARDRLEKIERSVLQRLNVAAADDLEELRARVADLEKRLLRAEEQLARHDAAESI